MRPVHLQGEKLHDLQTELFMKGWSCWQGCKGSFLVLGENLTCFQESEETSNQKTKSYVTFKILLIPINGVFMEKFTLKILLLIYVYVFRLLCWKILSLVFLRWKVEKFRFFWKRLWANWAPEPAGLCMGAKPAQIQSGRRTRTDSSWSRDSWVFQETDQEIFSPRCFLIFLWQERMWEAGVEKWTLKWSSMSFDPVNLSWNIPSTIEWCAGRTIIAVNIKKEAEGEWNVALLKNISGWSKIKNTKISIRKNWTKIKIPIGIKSDQNGFSATFAYFAGPPNSYQESEGTVR